MATTTSRDSLHRLVDALPDAALDAAARYLEALGRPDPVLRALLLAPTDDEPETDEERAAVAEARADYGRGEWATLEEVRRELGL
jgi:hypothetical protein